MVFVILYKCLVLTKYYIIEMYWMTLWFTSTSATSNDSPDSSPYFILHSMAVGKSNQLHVTRSLAIPPPKQMPMRLHKSAALCSSAFYLCFRAWLLFVHCPLQNSDCLGLFFHWSIRQSMCSLEQVHLYRFKCSFACLFQKSHQT